MNIKYHPKFLNCENTYLHINYCLLWMLLPPPNCFLKICEISKFHNFLIFQPIFIRFSLFCSENFTLSSKIKLNLFRITSLKFQWMLLPPPAQKKEIYTGWPPKKRNGILPIIQVYNDWYQWMRYLLLRKMIPRSVDLEKKHFDLP